MLTPATDLVLGGCRLGDALGRGGVGTVYRGWQLTLEREVAVKVISVVAGDHSLKSRFKREVHTAAGLAHPHTIPIYGAGEEDCLLYIVMRLVAGPDLSTLVHRQGALPAVRAVELVEQVAEALDAAHAAGLVHRDVKPANVLVEDHDGVDHAFLSDFGLVRSVLGDTAITVAGQWLGTLDYIAPEQLNGEPIDRRADVYGLAGVLYTLLTGELPFPRENAAATAWAHTFTPPPALEGSAIPVGMGQTVAGGLSQVLAQGMAKRPADRYPSAGELARAARAALTGQGPGTRGIPAPASPVPAPPTRVGPPRAHSDTVVSQPRTQPAGRVAPPGPRPETRASARATRTDPSRARSSARRALVVALLVLVGAAVSVAAWVLLTASRDARHAGTASSPPSAPQRHRTPTPAPAPAYSPYPGVAYSAQYPAGWQVIEAERPMGPYFRTEFASPDGGRTVLIDRTPGETLAPRVKALEVETATASTPGYSQVAFASATLRGRPALIWEFVLAGAPNGARVDIFETLGGSGYAVLGEAQTVARALPVARAVAASLLPR